MEETVLIVTLRITVYLHFLAELFLFCCRKLIGFNRSRNRQQAVFW